MSAEATAAALKQLVAFTGRIEWADIPEPVQRRAALVLSDDLAAMDNLRRAFNPRGDLSPHKMLPTAGACGMERRRAARVAAAGDNKVGRDVT